MCQTYAVPLLTIASNYSSPCPMLMKTNVDSAFAYMGYAFTGSSVWIIPVECIVEFFRFS